MDEVEDKNNKKWTGMELRYDNGPVNRYDIKLHVAKGMKTKKITHTTHKLINMKITTNNVNPDE